MASPNTVERRIYFYRVNAGIDDGGRPVPFDPLPSLKYLNELPFIDNGAKNPVRYLESTDGQVTCCWIDQVEMPCRMRIGNIRRNGLPQIENLGVLTPLDVPASSGLAEQTHIVFFPENIVGAEYNYYGPRLSRMSYYLCEKAGGHCKFIQFEPLLRSDIAQQIEGLRDLRLLQLKIYAPFAHTVAKADESLGAALSATLSAYNPETVEIVLRSEPRKRRGGIHGGLELVKRVMGIQGIREGADTFVVKGMDAQTNRLQTVDVLSDQLISKKKILLADSRARAVDRDSAYTAIEQAYEELREEIQMASGLSE